MVVESVYNRLHCARCAAPGRATKHHNTPQHLPLPPPTLLARFLDQNTKAVGHLCFVTFCDVRQS